MAKHRRKARRTTKQSMPEPRPTVLGVRPVAWSALIGTAFMAVAAGPAYADPNPAPPDTGSRPMPSGQLRLPGSRPSTNPTQVVAPVLGPLAQQIIAAEMEVGRLGEQLKGLQEELNGARARSADTQRIWQEATDQVAQLRSQADAVANDAYREATRLEPFGTLGSDLRNLDLLVPGSEEDVTGTETAARELGWAEADERTKLLAYNAALAVELELTGRYGSINSQFLQRQGTLLDLKRRNVDQLARVEAEREAFEQSRAGTYGKTGNIVDGMMANPNAIKAMQFALSQLGKPYEWGAEGPNSYDCSGLMWASYRPYRLLNRVAKDQYRQTSTSPVPLNKLLPGDLLFFSSTGGDWTSVSHVAMYIGDGRMVHTATRGDVAKIATVWWSRIYAATRVLPAVLAPSPSPTPTRTPSPTPTRTTSPSPSPSPSPSSSPPPSSTSPSPTNSSSPDTPPPSSSPSSSPTGGPAPDDDPSESPDPSESASPAP